MISLGDKVKDSVTGFIGIAVCKMSWLHGCERYGVQCEFKKGDKSVSDIQYFDAPQLVIVKKNAVKKGNNDTGGPHGREPLSRTER